MTVLGTSEPIVVGVALDAERLGAVGEVAVGPSEYREIRLGCIGRILTSTNVGTRLNLRYFKRRLRLEIPRSGSVDVVAQRAKDQAALLLRPFFETPDGNPRPVTLFVHFRKRVPPEVAARGPGDPEGRVRDGQVLRSGCPSPRSPHLGTTLLDRREGGSIGHRPRARGRSGGGRGTRRGAARSRGTDSHAGAPQLLHFPAGHDPACLCCGKRRTSDAVEPGRSGNRCEERLGAAAGCSEHGARAGKVRPFSPHD